MYSSPEKGVCLTGNGNVPHQGCEVTHQESTQFVQGDPITVHVKQLSVQESAIKNIKEFWSLLS